MPQAKSLKGHRQHRRKESVIENDLRKNRMPEHPEKSSMCPPCVSPRKHINQLFSLHRHGRPQEPSAPEPAEPAGPSAWGPTSRPGSSLQVEAKSSLHSAYGASGHGAFHGGGHGPWSEAAERGGTNRTVNPEERTVLRKCELSGCEYRNLVYHLVHAGRVLHTILPSGNEAFFMDGTFMLNCSYIMQCNCLLLNLSLDPSL